MDVAQRPQMLKTPKTFQMLKAPLVPQRSIEELPDDAWGGSSSSQEDSEEEEKKGEERKKRTLKRKKRTSWKYKLINYKGKTFSQSKNKLYKEFGMDFVEKNKSKICAAL
jgi:hypothetical protein